jgi:predicted DNA-binding ribbon-helix-helix protein
MSSLFVKRTVHIDGDRVEVAIEDQFWSSLEEIAATQGTTTSRLLAAIESERHGANLSSAIRVYVVGHFMSQAQSLAELDDDYADAPMHTPAPALARPRWLN